MEATEIADLNEEMDAAVGVDHGGATTQRDCAGIGNDIGRFAPLGKGDNGGHLR